jgi:hypothetical protein
MGTYKMIVSSSPPEMGQELWGLLGSGPGAACQRCHPMLDDQIHPLNKSGVQPSREAQSLQSDLGPKAHHMRDPHQFTPSITFLYLAVDQTRSYLPSTGFPPMTPHL